MKKPAACVSTPLSICAAVCIYAILRIFDSIHHSLMCSAVNVWLFKMQSNNNNNNNEIQEENNGKESIQGSEREKLEKYSNYERISLFAISHSWFGSGHMFTVSFDCYLNLLKLHLGSWLLYRSLPVVQLPLSLSLRSVSFRLFAFWWRTFITE